MIEVLVGIVLNADGDVLIQERPQGKPLAGFWEFPGGKRHAGESRQDALSRELNEELAITVLAADPWRQLEFHYPQRHVLLHIWQVTDWRGTPRAMEGQSFAFVAVGDLTRYKMLEANDEIIAEMQSSA